MTFERAKQMYTDTASELEKTLACRPILSSRTYNPLVIDALFALHDASRRALLVITTMRREHPDLYELWIKAEPRTRALAGK